MRIRHQVKIPFGQNAAAPLKIVSDAPGYMLQVQDTNGAPIVTLGLDCRPGQYGWKVLRGEGVRDDTPAGL